AEAHTTFEKANGDPKMLEEAERLTFRAERLHGPYSMWDLRERPSKLRGEIEAARGKSRKNRLPAAPGTEAAKTEPTNPVPAKAAAEPSAPAPMPKGPVLQASATVPASGPALPPPPEPVVPSPLPPGPAVAGGPEMPPTVTPHMAPAPVPDKAQAQRLLTDARQFQKEGRLAEAAQRARDAKKAGATFGPDEDRPEVALLAAAALGEKRIEGLLQQAPDLASAPPTDPSRYQKAEAVLVQARQLADAFGFDAQPIRAKMSWLQQMQEPQPPRADRATVAATAP